MAIAIRLKVHGAAVGGGSHGCFTRRRRDFDPEFSPSLLDVWLTMALENSLRKGFETALGSLIRTYPRGCASGVLLLVKRIGLGG